MADSDALPHQSAHEGVYYAVQWWAGESSEGEDRVIELERVDGDEVAIYIRGISGSEDVGSIYMSVAMAQLVAQVLDDQAAIDWEARHA